MQLDAFITRTSGLLFRIAASANFSLQSDQATFNRALVSWLKDPDSNLPSGHIIGLCCSSLLSIRFPDESRGNDLIPEFRRFVLAVSLAHHGRRNSNKSKPPQKHEHCARHESRSHLIRRLDGILTPQYLSNCSPESCQVLFHLVLGAVLDMGHSPLHTTTSYDSSSSSSSTAPSNLLSPECQQSPTLWLSTKNQLVRTLARDLVFLGSSKLGIKLEGTTDLEKLIIGTAISRWNEMESRIWADSITEKAATGQEPQSPTSSASPASKSPSCERERRHSSSPTDDDSNLNRNPPYWEDPPPTPPPPTIEPTLIPVMPPYHQHFTAPHTQFQSQFQTAAARISFWSENPASYLEMTDEPESYYLASANEHNKRERAEPRPTAMPTTTTGIPRSTTDPFPLRSTIEDLGSWRKVKRRTMWVVRTIDAGDQGQISIHARLRGREVNDFGVFV
ncbi:hypothetical protein NEUTE1DRAFT_71608 [Neurospora tetrasperma FGSC 2508]|uniref:Uncharacterized protein n=1 Tax=Neurospora tetrasperma (strain FGSC 2508 / ATCC MYA-4615 / P0657) TaxID=510951 RepID=F8N0Z1_NEUT8|nr:uncharacterized protein NEUTE1DRAFT_71608 [Neurospora tetrasperma FGSC 2508]EGO52228.1 hypothetical protein NEUTE1DRAFT_71608 [Neurospora tetrasperma FGSC 2508]